MARAIATGEDNFVTIRKDNSFYIDTTRFIKDWWNNRAKVTLITRPRRFGKTLMLDTVNTFFSPKYAGQSKLFEGLEIWQDEEFRSLQGSIPVIFLSFADIKCADYNLAMKMIKEALAYVYNDFQKLYRVDALLKTEKEQFD